MSVLCYYDWPVLTILYLTSHHQTIAISTRIPLLAVTIIVLRHLFCNNTQLLVIYHINDSSAYICKMISRVIPVDCFGGGYPTLAELELDQKQNLTPSVQCDIYYIALQSVSFYECVSRGLVVLPTISCGIELLNN